MPEPGDPSPETPTGNATALRPAARVTVIVCVIASLCLMLYAGRHNTHIFITILFIVWVSAPFSALLWVHGVVLRRPVPNQKLIYVAMIVTSVASLLAYIIDGILPGHPQQAFVFVMVPIVSWPAVALMVLAVYRKYRT